MTLNLQTPAFEYSQPIPVRFTGDGADVSPELTWTDPPAGTRDLALIVDDPDAPTAEPWVHWVIYKIPPEVRKLAEGIPARPALDRPAGTVQGKNSWGTVGYRGPAPPKGHGTHHYHFRLYALDAPVHAAAGLDKNAVLKLMKGHILAQAELVGTYQR
jgi:Raf kinase inhibitor-like YbhB/YbcL family protein